jgi:hypothetical protein
MRRSCWTRSTNAVESVINSRLNYERLVLGCEAFVVENERFVLERVRFGLGRERFVLEYVRFVELHEQRDGV